MIDPAIGQIHLFLTNGKELSYTYIRDTFYEDDEGGMLRFVTILDNGLSLDCTIYIYQIVGYAVS